LYWRHPLVANSLKFITETTAFTVQSIVDPFHVHFTGESERAKHRWLKSSTLLICLIDDFNGSESFDPVFVKRTEHLKPREHAQDSVEPTSRPLSVEVAADDHRWERLTRASPTENHSTELID
jgi:hypothetical protein